MWDGKILPEFLDDNMRRLNPKSLSEYWVKNKMVKMVAQTPDFFTALGGNTDHDYQHRLQMQFSWTKSADIVLCISLNPVKTITLVGIAGHSDQCAPGSSKVLEHQRGPRWWPRYEVSAYPSMETGALYINAKFDYIRVITWHGLGWQHLSLSSVWTQQWYRTRTLTWPEEAFQIPGTGGLWWQHRKQTLALEGPWTQTRSLATAQAQMSSCS